MTPATISPRQLADLCKTRTIDLLDVRTPLEYQEFHAADARNVPLDRLDPAAAMRGRAGSPDEPLYLICRSGSRGRQACEKFLAAQRMVYTKEKDAEERAWGDLCQMLLASNAFLYVE